MQTVSGNSLNAAWDETISDICIKANGAKHSSEIGRVLQNV